MAASPAAGREIHFLFLSTLPPDFASRSLSVFFLYFMRQEEEVLVHSPAKKMPTFPDLIISLLKSWSRPHVP